MLELLPLWTEFPVMMPYGIEFAFVEQLDLAMQALEAGLSAAGSLGVIHLALHSSQQGLVTSWKTRLKAYIDPGTVNSLCTDNLM